MLGPSKLYPLLALDEGGLRQLRQRTHHPIPGSGEVREFGGRFDKIDDRFEVLETTLRDLAEQMVILGRGVEVAIESRARFEERVDDHERRLLEIENGMAI